jgi:uncharacterized protein YecT (DUF1311 family)
MVTRKLQNKIFRLYEMLPVQQRGLKLIVTQRAWLEAHKHAACDRVFLKENSS